MEKENGKRVLTKKELEKVTGSGGKECLQTNTNCTEVVFTTNTSLSSGGGGAIYVEETPKNFSGMEITFNQNTPTSSGGAIYTKK